MYTRVDNAAIDVLPGVYPNAIGGSDMGDLEVAVLCSEGVDVTTLDPATVILTNLKGTGTVRASGWGAVRDVNGDGCQDALFSFPLPALREAGVLTQETTRVLFNARTRSDVGVFAQDGMYDASHAVVEIPIPTGPFAVGTTAFTWTDSAREETFTASPDDRRAVQVRLWYPARRMPQAQPAPYFLNPYEGELLADSQEYPPQLFGFFFAHAVRDAPMAEGSERFPVLLFSPGYGTGTAVYSSPAEELASQGYVVAAISHPFTGGPLVFPDGRVVPHTIEISPADSAQNAHIQEVWTGDARFVLDQLEKLGAEASGSRFVDRFDFSRVGMFGHSFGGSTAGDACRTDVRFKAGLNMDGTFHGDEDAEVHVPFLVMNSDDTGADPTRATFFRNLRATGYDASIHGTGHFSFSDLAIAMPLVRTYAPQVTGPDLGLGSMDGARTLSLTVTYLRAFFDKHLRERPTQLLDGPSPEFPEVDLVVHRP